MLIDITRGSLAAARQLKLGAVFLIGGYALLGLQASNTPAPGYSASVFDICVLLLRAGAFGVGIALVMASALRHARGVPSMRARIAIGSAAFGLALFGVWRILDPAATPVEFPLGGGILWRDWLILAYPDLALTLGFMVLGAALAGGRLCSSGMSFAIYAGAALAFLVVANLYFLGLPGVLLHPFPDSADYVSVNACRVPGYLGFLIPFMNHDPLWLVAAQLNLLLLAKVAISAAVYAVTASAGAAILTLLLSAMFTGMSAYAFAILTEAPYVGLMGLVAAAMMTYMRIPKPWLAATAGVLLAAATAIKAVAPLLIIVAATLLLRRTPYRRLNAILLLGPPLLCLIGLCAFGRATNGSWSPSVFAGYSLSSHVGWGVRSDHLSHDAGLSRQLEASLRPIVERWPPIHETRAYVRQSSNDVNAIGYGIIFPTVMMRVDPDIRSSHAKLLTCSRAVNEALMRLSQEAIQRFPATYAAHVAVHFGAIWSLALMGARWEDIAAGSRSTDHSLSWVWDLLPAAWRSSQSETSDTITQAANHGQIRLFIDHLIPVNGRWLQYMSLAVGLLTIFVAATVARLPKQRPEVAALVPLAFLVNCNFAGQAMFQPALPRYAGSAEIPIAAVIAISVFIAVRCAAAYFTSGPQAREGSVGRA